MYLDMEWKVLGSYLDMRQRDEDDGIDSPGNNAIGLSQTRDRAC
jgi:hypothetical protein